MALLVEPTAPNYPAIAIPKPVLTSSGASDPRANSSPSQLSRNAWIVPSDPSLTSSLSTPVDQSRNPSSIAHLTRDSLQYPDTRYPAMSFTSSSTYAPAGMGVPAAAVNLANGVPHTPTSSFNNRSATVPSSSQHLPSSSSAILPQQQHQHAQYQHLPQQAQLQQNHQHHPQQQLPPSASQQSTPQNSQTSLQASQQGVSAQPPSEAQNHPAIYTAVYSGVSVYEMIINDVAVMRRRSDSWLNATQILKVANVDKGKRTKILEREILCHEHEKVQGGYGRYQGTWINYRRGREFCRSYGVEDLLRPLLDYDMGQDGAQPGKGVIETPTKEQAMAAQRKRSMYNSIDSRAGSIPTPNGTFFQNISSTAVNAINAINRARVDSPGPKQNRSFSRPAGLPTDNSFPGGSQQSMTSVHSEPGQSFATPVDAVFGSQGSQAAAAAAVRDDGPPRKRLRPDDPESISQTLNSEPDHKMMRVNTPTEPNESFVYPPPRLDAHEGDHLRQEPLPNPTTAREKEDKHRLASLFLESPDHDQPNHVRLQAMDGLRGMELDMPIDASCHTALHWAATLAMPALIHALIARGASIYRVNALGESALMRAALTTNNLDHGSFPELLELLGPTIEIRDNRGRTVLHHIAVSSAIKGRSSACRYYLDCLLAFVVRQGSGGLGSQPSSFSVMSPDDSRPKAMGLARFLNEIVNAQDSSGDTALNLAARLNSQTIITQLLEVGANPSIANYGGLKPLDFGIGALSSRTDLASQPNGHFPDMNATPTADLLPKQEAPGSRSSQGSAPGESRFKLATKSFVDSVQKVLGDAEASLESELRSRQAMIDSAHAELQTLTEDVRQQREQLDAQLDVHRQHQTAHRRAENLRGYIGTLQQRLSQLPPRSTAVPPDVDLGAQSTEWLRARLMALGQHNALLEQKRDELRLDSEELEAKMKSVVAHFTGHDPRYLQRILRSLILAVRSDEGQRLDIGRIGDLLQQDVEGEVA